MLIMGLWSIKNTLLINRICIKTLNLNNSGKIPSNAQNSSCKANNTNNINQAIYLTDLWQIWEINNFKNNQKQKIISILRYCSRKHSVSKKAEDINARKYMQRFKYKYQRSHKYKFKSQVKRKELNNHEINIISIIALYTIYKIMATESKLCASKEFSSHSTIYLPSDIA